MAPRLPELIKRALRLALERDRLVHELAREWTTALKGQGFSPRDLDELWAGLTEEAVRRLLKTAAGSVGAQALRREANEVIARVKERVETGLAAGGEGPGGGGGGGGGARASRPHSGACRRWTLS